MRLSRAAACRSIAGCLLALTLASGAPAAAAPNTPAGLLDLAAQQKDLTTFVAAVKTAGLESRLNGAGPMVVFAPTDAAFAKMPAADRAGLLADPARLKELILGSIALESVVMNDNDGAVWQGSLASMGTGKLVFGAEGGRQTVNAAHLVRADLRAANGTLNEIDRVLLP